MSLATKISMMYANKLSKRANSHLQAGENLQAASLFERLLLSDPGNQFLRSKLVTAYLRESAKVDPKNTAEIERLLESALRIDNRNEQAHLSYIKYLRRQGRHQEADDRQNEFINLCEVMPETRYLLANIAYGAREYARAADQLEQLLASEPDHALAKSLHLAARYRAGHHDHPSMEQERQKQAKPIGFTEGLGRIAKAIGVGQSPSSAEHLPDRSSWTEAQRYEWGRRVDTLIRDQILGGLEARANVLRYAPAFSLPPALHDGGAVVLLLHAGSIHLAFGQVVASGIPFNHVTNSLHLGVAFPGQIFDTNAIPANALLSRMAMALRRGSCVTVAADGPLGQRADGFEYLGVEYSIAAGPLILANKMRARTYLLVAGYEERNFGFRLVEGPTSETTYEDLVSFWGREIRTEVARLMDWGPENYIQHASSQIKSVTVNPYRPK